MLMRLLLTGKLSPVNILSRSAQHRAQRPSGRSLQQTLYPAETVVAAVAAQAGILVWTISRPGYRVILEAVEMGKVRFRLVIPLRSIRTVLAAVAEGIFAAQTITISPVVWAAQMAVAALLENIRVIPISPAAVEATTAAARAVQALTAAVTVVPALHFMVPEAVAAGSRLCRILGRRIQALAARGIRVSCMSVCPCS